MAADRKKTGQVRVGLALGGLVPGSVKGTAEVMAHVTAHFGKFLDECREEAGLSKELMEEFHHFWLEDFTVVHRELGCAVICMRRKLQLQRDDANINPEKLHEYIMGFPQGETLAAKMVELIHNCEKQHIDISDDCSRVVKVAACFKVKAKEARVVPEVAMIEAVLEKY